MITREGRPAVELRVITQAIKPTKAEIYDRLARLRATLPPSREASADLIRRIRDEGVG